MKKKLLDKIKYNNSRLTFTFIVIVCALLTPSTLFSHTPVNNGRLGQLMQREKVTIDMKNTSLETILQEIRKQTGLNFMLKSDVNRKALGNLSLKVTNVTVEEALKTLFAPTNYTYRIIDKMITVVKRAELKINTNKVMVTGKVINEENKPLAGVTIVVKNTKNGAITDAGGRFSFTAQVGEELELTYVGMTTLSYTLGENPSNLVLTLKADKMVMEDVVVIGYGTTTKKDLTGSVFHIGEELFNQSAASDIAHIIQGQVPGMYVLTGTGAPGAAVQMQIRGISSIKGNVNPLIVLDQVPMPDSFDISSLNPKDIKSIDVLTDASAAAIYGSRASAGVIIVTTKKGTATQKARVSYSGNYGVEQMTSDINVLSPEEFKLLMMEAIKNSAIENGVQNIEDFVGYKTVMAPNFFGESNTEWMKLLMRTAYKQGHNLSVAGGSQASRYYLSLGYNNEVGQVIGTSLDKYTLSLNMNNQLARSVDIGVSLKGNYSDNNSNARSMMNATTARPDLPAFNADGSHYIHEYIGADGRSAYLENPLLEVENEDNRKNYGLFGSLFLNVNILRNLSLRASFSMDYYADKTRRYSKGTSYAGSGGYKGTEKGQLAEGTGNTLKKEGEITMSYNKKIKNHFFDIVIGGNYIRNQRNDVNFSFGGFADDYIQTGIWQGATLMNKNGNDRASIMLSGFARANYNYKSKYYLTVSIRSDGSSSFARNNRYGTFPAVALAYNIAEEKIFDSAKWLNLLKIRASWGKTGMASIGEYGWRTLFQSTSYMGQPAFIPRQIGNDNLKWESTEQLNLAIDFSLLKGGRISGTFSVYDKQSRDVLYPFTPSLSTGITTNATVNLAAINNKGLELNINTRIIENKNVRFELGFNISQNTSKITGLGKEYASSLTSSTLGNTVIKEGSTLGLFYGYKTDGLFQTWEEIYACEALNKDKPYQGDRYTKTSPGDIKFVDLSGDGYVSMEYTHEEDKQVLGSSVPDFTGGMNARVSWKGLSLSMQGTFSYGNLKSWDGEGKQFVMPYNNPSNLMNFSLKRWTPENPNARYPKMKTENKLANYFSDYYLHDASYFKLQNVSLSYALPQAILAKLKIFSSIDVSFSANNLFVITRYPGPSPESFSSNRIQGAAVDYSVYPSTRVFNFGLRLSL